MRFVACLISFYILSLALTPAIKLAMSLYTDKCAAGCSAESNKDADGCAEQTCSPFSCCLKTLAFIETPALPIQKPALCYHTRNNYTVKALIDSRRIGAVWHPPKLI